MMRGVHFIANAHNYHFHWEFATRLAKAVLNLFYSNIHVYNFISINFLYIVLHRCVVKCNKKCWSIQCSYRFLLFPHQAWFWPIKHIGMVKVFCNMVRNYQSDIVDSRTTYWYLHKADKNLINIWLMLFKQL